MVLNKLWILIMLLIPLGVFAQIENIYGFQNGSHNWFDGDWYDRYIKVGEIYPIWHYRANIRTAPGRDNAVIAVLRLFDEVEVLEKSDAKETINGLTAHWYKVKFGNIIGYTFGFNMDNKVFGMWCTLEEYESHLYSGFYSNKRVTDDNGKTWIYIHHKGKD